MLATVSGALAYCAIVSHIGQPFIIGEFVAMVVCRHDIHQEYIFSFGVQSSDLHFEAGKHSPAMKQKYKLGLELISGSYGIKDTNKK